MKKKIYTKQDFLTGKIAIYTPTQRKYNKLMPRLYKAGFKWINHSSNTDQYKEFYKTYKESTCITLDVGCLEYSHKFCYKEEYGKTIIKPHEITFKEEKEDNIIDTKEKFKDCYIDLSNKKLNGEVTEEVFNKLKECFCKIINGENNFSCEYHDDGSKWENRTVIIWDDVIGNYSSKMIGYEKFKHFKEVSIYDIAGMGKKPYTLDDLEQELMQDPEFVEEYKKEKYTIEQLKTEKIAVHLPTQEEFNTGIKFFKDNGIKGCYESLKIISPYIGIKDNTLEIYYPMIEYNDSYTIINLDQLQIGEEYETEEQIQGNFTKEMIDHISKDPKYKTTQESIRKIIDELIEKEIAKNKDEEAPTALELKTCRYNIDANFSDDNLKEVRIILGDKQKVITRDDFEEINDHTKDCLGYAYEEELTRITDKVCEEIHKNFYPDNPEKLHRTGIHYGSRAWALLALDRGEKIRNYRYSKSFIYIKEEELLGSDGSPIGEYIQWFKDGWELYKDPEEEPKKTMTLEELLLSRIKSCSFKFLEEDEDIHYYEDGKITYKWNGVTQILSIEDIARMIKIKIEIIKE